ncbi:MAG: hypothetical protein WC382_13700 [Methanoregulaceae archaeon]
MKKFIMGRRKGIDNDSDNVLEMYYEAAADNFRKNYLFIGRKGTAEKQNFTDQTTLHGVYDVRAEVNRVHKYEQRPSIYTTNLNAISALGEGVGTYIAGEGSNGFSSLAFLTERLIFSNNTDKGVVTISIADPGVATLTDHGLLTGDKINFTTTGWLPFPLLPKSLSRGIASISISNPAIITIISHLLLTGDRVRFTTTGFLPTGLLPNTDYYVYKINDDTFNLTDSSGLFIATTGTESGTHTLFLMTDYYVIKINDDTFNIALSYANALDGITITTSNFTIGDLTSQWDVTNPGGTTFRYTWDGTGTDPLINGYLSSGETIIISGFNALNNGTFTIINVGLNYFDIANAGGMVESNITNAVISTTQSGTHTLFSLSPSFAVGDTISGNASNATAKIIYKIDSNNYYCNHTSYGIDFNTLTDTACTTDGAGGGSGTAKVDSFLWQSISPLYVTDNLNITAGNHFIPNATDSYDIGSLSSYFLNGYIRNLHSSAVYPGDIYLYDYTTGGTNPPTGLTDHIYMQRSDDLAQKFSIQHRAGINYDDENAVEMFYEKDANGGKYNYLFLGRDGTNSYSNHTDFVMLNGTRSVAAEISGMHKYWQRMSMYSYDRHKDDPTKYGVSTYIAGEGLDGYSGLAFQTEKLTFSSPTAFAVGDTITGNFSGATALIKVKVSTTVFYCNHTSYGVDFSVSDDNACTTNGAGGGTGTGTLGDQLFTASVPLWVDDYLDANATAIRFVPSATDYAGTREGLEWYNSTLHRKRVRINTGAETVAFLSDITALPIYDAVVAPSGGNYTTLSAAIAAGGKYSIYVRGTINETANINISTIKNLVFESGAKIDFGGTNHYVYDKASYYFRKNLRIENSTATHNFSLSSDVGVYPTGNIYEDFYSDGAIFIGGQMGNVIYNYFLRPTVRNIYLSSYAVKNTIDSPLIVNTTANPGISFYGNPGYSGSYDNLIINPTISCSASHGIAMYGTHEGFQSSGTLRNTVLGGNISVAGANKHAIYIYGATNGDSSYHLIKGVRLSSAGGYGWKVSNFTGTCSANMFSQNYFGTCASGNYSDGGTGTVINEGQLMGKSLVNSLSSYANNAAALAGGLVAGQLYRSGGDPDIVAIVH